MIKHTTFARVVLDKNGFPITDAMLREYFERELSTVVGDKMRISEIEDSSTHVTKIAEVVILSCDELVKIISDARTKGMEDFAEIIKKINGA
ncbi:MAG TPA: hypothetical protein PK317_03370 [Coprothermobacter proteolyticus]|nr:hypothetical protein [Coprothermobacter proteolyticus]